VRYVRRENNLEVEVDPAPGQVEIVLYGVSAATANRDGRSLPLTERQGGQQVSFEGTAASTITFLLEG